MGSSACLEEASAYVGTRPGVIERTFALTKRLLPRHDTPRILGQVGRCTSRTCSASPAAIGSRIVPFGNRLGTLRTPLATRSSCSTSLTPLALNSLAARPARGVTRIAQEEVRKFLATYRNKAIYDLPVSAEQHFIPANECTDLTCTSGTRNEFDENRDPS